MWWGERERERRRRRWRRKKTSRYHRRRSKRSKSVMMDGLCVHSLDQIVPIHPPM